MKPWKVFDSQIHSVMSRNEARDYDQWAIHEMGIPGIVLMENAGRSCAEIALELLEFRQSPHVCVFCGPGNNGGDGYVAARHLFNWGCDVHIILCAPRGKIQGDALSNLKIAEKMSIPIHDMNLSEMSILNQVSELCQKPELIIDALFGTGLKDELSDPYIALISSLNAAAVPILAVDIPSGLDCDEGIPLPVCIEATATVSFIAAKKGFFCTAASRKTAGSLYVASIGICTKKTRI